MKLLHVLYLAFFLAAPSGTLALGQEMNDDEQAVWQLEEDYWRYVKERDMDRYLALWDEHFVGWPSFASTPQGKANITDWIDPLFADPNRVVDFELKREAVRSFGDIVVTHYLAWRVFRDATTGGLLERKPKRFTHTWRRSGDAWQIISGMSAAPISAE